MKKRRVFSAVPLLSCLIAALVLMLSSCATLGVAHEGAGYFAGKKEKTLVRYFRSLGYEGDVLAEDGDGFDRMVYFSTRYIAAYMEWSKTTYTKRGRYSDINNFQFLKMSDGCYVAMGNSHYVSHYDPGTQSTIGGRNGAVTVGQGGPTTYTTHRNDNGIVSGWINQFNSNIKSLGAIGWEYVNSRFDAGDIGDTYYLYSRDSEPATLGGEPATLYRYSLDRVDIYLDEQTQGDTQAAYYYDISKDVYYAADRRTVISKDDALANVSGYQSQGYTLRKETKGLSLVAFIKEGVVDEVFEASNAASALTLAAAGNSFAWVNEILLAGANPDTLDENGHTALIWAAGYGYENIVRLLLANGANTNIRGGGGWTALNAAASCDDAEIVRLLLNAGSNPDIQNDYGKTALIYAAIHDNAEIAKLLLEAGANPSIRDKDGETALDYATDAEIVRMLRNL